ncbi:MAG: FG-GAP-like repeat-containing protein [Acidobacteriaceae bacterium]
MFSRRGWLTVAVAALFALPAFTQTDFQYQSYPTPNNGSVSLVTLNGHVADFNGDGLADLLEASYQDCSSGTCKPGYGLYLQMNNGSGGLESAQQLNVFGTQAPAYSASWYITVGDFNGDGNLDIAALHASGLMSVLYGHGDGTFAAPVISFLPAGTYTSLVEADFDANGTQDLAALNQNGQLVVLFNDGKGNFTPQIVTLDTPSSAYTTEDLTVGDFNGDGRPDLAWAEEANDLRDDTSPIMAALNTGKGVFSTKQQVGTSPTNGFPRIVSADLDLDGKSDLIVWTAELDGCCSGYPQTLYYSNGDGTFTGQQLATISDINDAEVADIDGDGNPDVLIASAYGGVEVFTGNGNRTFTDAGAYTSLPGGAGQMGFGFFTASNAVGFAAVNGGGDGTMTSPNDGLYVAANDNIQGNCPYPTSPGVTFCSAVEGNYTATVRGTARAQTQPVKEIQLWANGEEVYQAESDEFSATLNNIAPGTQITAVEVEANGATHSTTVTPTEPNPCPAPSSPGVSVCTPTQGQTGGSPVEVTASGTGASGTVNHLELWIDGSKNGNYNGNFMQTFVSLTDGSHALTVVEVDSKGNYIRSNVVNISVTSPYGCSGPSSPGVNVCSPLGGQTVSSPVPVIAAGTGASGTVNHLELWIDGSKQGNYSGASMNASVPLASGSHAITVVEVDSKGAYVKSNVVNITVGSGPCQAPSTPGVNVCSPTQGAKVGSPVTVTAAGKGVSTVDHLELWIDGSKIGNYKGATMSASVLLAAGSHGITVVEVDTTYSYAKSNVVNVTVQ